MAQPLPARRPDEARGARRRPRPRPRDRGQAREPGDLLRARRRLPRRAAVAGRLDAASPGRSSTPTGRGSASTPAPPGTRSGSARASASRSASRGYVSRIDPATNTIVLGRREDLETRRIELEERHVRRGRAARRPRRGRAWRRSARRCGSAIARRSSTRGSGRRAPPSPRAAAAWTVETDTPVWADRARARPASLYDGDTCLGGGRIAAPAPDAPATPAAERPRRGAGPRMTIGPALPLALLVGPAPHRRSTC